MIPLINNKKLSETLLHTNNEAMSCATALGLAINLSRSLPQTKYIINFCKSAENFIIGFLAAMINQQISLLPHNTAQATMAELQKSYPDSFVLTDTDLNNLTMLDCQNIPEINSQQPACIFFTSGSTGKPKSYTKTWGELVARAKLMAEILTLDENNLELVSSVPLQHLFGFEHGVVLLLQSKVVLNTQKIFFPKDLSMLGQQLSNPGILISTPYHLKCFLQADLSYVDFNFVLSSTASLPINLARQAEQQFNANVVEVYGCTELGAIATRKPTVSQTWQALDGIVIKQNNDEFTVHDEITNQQIALPDQLVLEQKNRFNITGRKVDNLNIAGKRMSLADLNLKLNAIDGIKDAVIYLPNYLHDGLRLVAFVVSDSLTTAEIKVKLMQQVDNVFIPKYIIKLEQLPHNDTGKILKSVLDKFVLAHLSPDFSFKIAANHSALAGHFPGNPVVPGVLVLEKIMGLYYKINPDFKLNKFNKVKFSQKLLAEQLVKVSFEITNKHINFQASVAEQRIAFGSFC